MPRLLLGPRAPDTGWTRGKIPEPTMWDAKGDPRLRVRIIVARIDLEESLFLTLSQDSKKIICDKLLAWTISS
jgi:hypothetical protein